MARRPRLSERAAGRHGAPPPVRMLGCAYVGRPPHRRVCTCSPPRPSWRFTTASSTGTRTTVVTCPGGAPLIHTAILVSEIMLQQTQVSRVVPKYQTFLAAFPTLEALAAAPLADVLRMWRGLGYNNRAVRLRAVRHRLSAGRVRGGRTTRGPAALQALPGLGPYTARAVLVFAHNDDLAAVDANVRRRAHPRARPAARPAPRSASGRRRRRAAARTQPRVAQRAHGLRFRRPHEGGPRASPPRTRQGVFEGSRRWHRSRLLRLLLRATARCRSRSSPATCELHAS